MDHINLKDLFDERHPDLAAAVDEISLKVYGPCMACDDERYLSIWREEVQKAGLSHHEITLYLVYLPQSRTMPAPAGSLGTKKRGYSVFLRDNVLDSRLADANCSTKFVMLDSLSLVELVRHYMRHELGHILHGDLDIPLKKYTREITYRESLADLYAARALDPFWYGILYNVVRYRILGGDFVCKFAVYGKRPWFMCTHPSKIGTGSDR